MHLHEFVEIVSVPSPGVNPPMVVDDVVPQAAPGVAVVGPGPVAVPPSVAVGKGVSSYSAAALSTLKRRLGAGNRTVGGKRHKVCSERILGYIPGSLNIKS